MKNPSSLKKSALVLAMRDIQEALYGADGAVNPDKTWTYDTLDEIRDVLEAHGLLPMDERKKKIFAVYVHDRRDVKYIVRANDELHAQYLVEASDNADADYGYKILDSEWYVDCVKEEGSVGSEKSAPDS